MRARHASPTRRGVAWLGMAAAVGMFVVLVMGATVTSTGSAEGCGRDWPLCHGRFIPEFALATAIEFSHRAVTGVEGILILAFTIGALVCWRQHRAVRLLAPLMLAALILQAGMGAWAVKYPQQPVVLALHFGISLVALASTALTALYVWGEGRHAFGASVSRPLRLSTWGTAVYIYLLVYSGAFIRHVGAAGACPSWPLCGGGPGSPGALALNLAHRSAAALALIVAIGLLVAYNRLPSPRSELIAGARLLVLALVTEAASGAYLVGSRWSLTGELLHAATTGITFTAIAYLCMMVSLGNRQKDPQGQDLRITPGAAAPG